jgi:hypothetical protein
VVGLVPGHQGGAFALPFVLKKQLTYMSINVQKIQKELSKGNETEQYEALKQVKDFVVESILTAKTKLQDKANGLQEMIEQVSKFQPNN